MSLRARALAAVAFALLCARCASGRAVRPPDAPPGPRGEGRMVGFAGGSYRMFERTGPLEDTPTYVSVGPFLLDETEVTVVAYAACVEARRCTPAAPATVDSDGLRPSGRAALAAFCNGERADHADHPVTCVDWRDAERYCAWAGKRLPTEEEWEWAARNGPRATPFPWGREAPADRACWSGEGNGAGRRDGTCPVGSHPAGDLAAGVKDLAGNVREWTSGRAVLFADSRGRGGVPAKIARGGGWMDTEAWELGSGVRAKLEPSRRRPDLGFRCAKDP